MKDFSLRMRAITQPAFVRPLGLVLVWRARLGAVPWLPLAWAALILLWVSAYLRAALASVAEFEPVMGDGPFQLYNPLRRIDAGQRGGVDFPFFHGLGVPYLHYPLYRLFGGDVFAAELSRQLVSLILAVAGWVAVFAAATRRLAPTLGLTAAALVLSDQLGLFTLAMPVHSLPGVRSAAPLFVVAVLLAGFRPWREAVLAGSVAGAGLLTGTEHGLAAAGLLALAWSGRRLAGLPGGSSSWPVLAGTAYLAAAGGGLLLIGGPAGIAAAFRYAFVELPADQFWYFGTPPNPFLTSVGDMFRDRGLVARSAGPAVVVMLLVLAWVRRDVAARPVGVVLIAALAAGLLSVVGYLAAAFPHYLQPLTRLVLLAGLVAGWQAIRLAGPAWAGLARTAVIGFTAIALLAGPTALAPSSLLSVRSIAVDTFRLGRTVSAGEAKYGPKLLAHLAELTAAIDADRAARGRTDPPVIWSCYAGLLEAHYGVFHPHRDYVIHALGPNGRMEYLNAFRRANPDYVTCFHRGGSGHQEWLETTTWPFFEEVLLNYEPIARSYCFTLWRRTAEPWHTPDGSEWRGVPSRADGFELPAADGENPWVVEVEYDFRNHWQGLPVTGQLPRCLVYPFDCRNSTPISLPPYATKHQFPVYPSAGKAPRFFATCVAPLGGARLYVRAVRARPLDADGRDRELILGLGR